MASNTNTNPTPKMKKLRNEAINPYMEETDPRNPYGPNYEELPYETKVYYKFNKVRKFVHLDKDDQDKLLSANFQSIFGTIASTAVGCLFAYGLRRFAIKPNLPRIDETIASHANLYYGFFFAGAGTLAYFQLGDMYIRDVSAPMLDKYLAEAIKNGFDDYKISDYRIVDKFEE